MLDSKVIGKLLQNLGSSVKNRCSLHFLINIAKIYLNKYSYYDLNSETWHDLQSSSFLFFEPKLTLLQVVSSKEEGEEGGEIFDKFFSTLG